MALNEQQIQKANKLLDRLCKAERLESEIIYSLFDKDKDAEYVCSVLENRDLVIAHWEEGNKIGMIISNENTCNASDNNLLGNELLRQTKSEDKLNLEIENLKLQKESSEYQLTIRGQQDRIRDLEEQIKVIELLKSYWWVLVTCIGIGALLSDLWTKK